MNGKIDKRKLPPTVVALIEKLEADGAEVIGIKNLKDGSVQGDENDPRIDAAIRVDPDTGEHYETPTSQQEAAIWERYRNEGVRFYREKAVEEGLSRDAFFAKFDVCMMEFEREHDARCDGRPSCEFKQSWQYIRKAMVEWFGGEPSYRNNASERGN